MAEVGYATLGIIPSFDGFERNLTRGTTGPMSAAGRAGGDSFGRSFGARAKSAVKVGVAGAAVAAAGAIKFAGDSIAEARDAQKVGAQTRAVIKSTGGAAKVTERSIGRLAERLSNMAGIDDELIQSGGNVLLTFTKIRNEAGKGNQVFDRATEAALNMSVALDQDLKSASIQVGKALNDPVKGVTALGRAGVQFSEDQKSAIKTMVEQGRTLDAQRMILRELDTQFKGSAKAQATEADKLSVAWGNLKEDVGNELLPVMDDLAVWIRTEGIPLAKRFGRFVRDDVVPAFQDFAREAEPAVQMAKDLAGFLNDLPKSVKIGGLGALAAAVGGAKLRGGNPGALGTAGKVLGMAKPVPVFVTNPGALGGGGLGGGKKGGMALAITTARLTGGLSLYATGVALFAKDVEDKTGVPKFGSPSNPLEPQILNPFEKNYDKSPGLRNDAFDKIRSDSIEAQTSIEQTQAKMKGLLGTIREVEKRDRIEVFVKALGLDGVINATNHWRDLLDDIDGRTVRVHYEGVQSKVAGQLDARGGGVDSGESLRSTTNVTNINVGEVRAHDYKDFERQMARKRRNRAGGGRGD